MSSKLTADPSDGSQHSTISRTCRAITVADEALQLHPPRSNNEAPKTEQQPCPTQLTVHPGTGQMLPGEKGSKDILSDPARITGWTPRPENSRVTKRMPYLLPRPKSLTIPAEAPPGEGQQLQDEVLAEGPGFSHREPPISKVPRVPTAKPPSVQAQPVHSKDARPVDIKQARPVYTKEDGVRFLEHPTMHKIPKAVRTKFLKQKGFSDEIIASCYEAINVVPVQKANQGCQSKPRSATKQPAAPTHVRVDSKADEQEVTINLSQRNRETKKRKENNIVSQENTAIFIGIRKMRERNVISKDIGETTLSVTKLTVHVIGTRTRKLQLCI